MKVCFKLKIPPERRVGLSWLNKEIVEQDTESYNYILKYQKATKLVIYNTYPLLRLVHQSQCLLLKVASIKHYMYTPFIRHVGKVMHIVPVTIPVLFYTTAIDKLLLQ